MRASPRMLDVGGNGAGAGESGGEPHDWFLFVDESGRFDLPREPVAVGAALVARRAYVPWRIGFPARLRSIAPDLPWPLSYKDLSSRALLCASHPRWHERASEQGAATCSLCKECRGAIATALSAGPAARAAVHAMQSSLSAERMPSYQDGRTANRSLVKVSLSSVDAEIARRLARVRDCVAAALQSRDAEGLTWQAAVLAGETAEGGSGSPDRYLAILRGLLRRTARLLASRPGRHVVQLQVASRHVVPEAGAHARELDDAILSELAREASVPGRVAFAAPWALRYHRAVGSGLVFADFIASSCGWQLRWIDLRTAERRVARTLGAVPRSVPPGGSHLAAAGRAQEVEAGGSEPAPLAGERAWAIEQAAEWRSLP